MLDLRLPAVLQSYETPGGNPALECVSIVSPGTHRPNI